MVKNAPIGRLTDCLPGCLLGRLIGGLLLLLSIFLTACDSDGDAHDLQNRVEVAANNYTSLQLAASNTVVEVGQSQQLTLNALSQGDSVGTSVVTSAVWSVINPQIASVDQTGLVTGLADGVANVRARYGPLFAAIAIQVSSADLSAIRIAAPVAAVNECGSVQLTASGTYNDGLPARDLTDDVAWSVAGTTTVGAFDSSDPSGFFRTSNAGLLSVTARRGDVDSEPFTLEVLDNLNIVEIDEPTGTLTASDDLQLSATATYDDGTTAEITDNASWSVNNTAVATIDNTLPSKGLLDASQTGSVTVSAACGGVPAGMLVVTSGDASVVEEVFFGRDSPYVFTFDGAETLQLRAYVRLETQQTKEITEDSRWTFVERGNALNQLNNSSGSKGELTIRGIGEIRVQVEYTGDDYDDNALNIPQLIIRPQ